MSWSIEQHETEVSLPQIFMGVPYREVKRYKDIIVVSRLRTFISKEPRNVLKFLERHYDTLKKIGIKYIVHHFGSIPVPLVDNTVYIYCSPYGSRFDADLDISLPREWERVGGLEFARGACKDCIAISNRSRLFFVYDPRHNVFILADVTHYYIPGVSESLWDFVVALMKKMKGMKEDPHEMVDELLKENILWLRYSSLKDVVTDLVRVKIETHESQILLPLEYNDGDITIKVTSDNVKIIGKTRVHRKGLQTKYFGDYLDKLENLEYDVEVEVELTYKPVIVNGVAKLQLDSVKGKGYVIIDGVRLWHPNIHGGSYDVCTGDVSIPRQITIEQNLLTELKYKSKIMELLASLTNPYLDNNASVFGYKLWKYINDHIICAEEDRYDEDDLE